MGAMKKIEEALKGKNKGKRAKAPPAEESPRVSKTMQAEATKKPAAHDEPAKKTGGNKADPAEIPELLEALKNAADVDEKKRLRRMLRARGHRGGLGAKGAKKETQAA